MLLARLSMLSTRLHAPIIHQNVKIINQFLYVKKPVQISNYTTGLEPKNPDVFGDLAGNKFEQIELDDDEQELEKFETNEHCVPKRLKPRPSQYAKMIEQHRNKGDMSSAMKVLDLVKENRDKPTYHMYNLLLKGWADQGDIRMCLKLLSIMKKKQLKKSGATYTSVLNACSNSNNREKALETLANIRLELIQNVAKLEEAHYNVMIKAYGKHNCLEEAFLLVDEMVDKKMKISEITFNSMMYAAISDGANGLRYVLRVWHLMQRWRIKPSISTYNLLLRAIRDTKLGDLKVNDLLLEHNERSRILWSDCLTPDLLANPPVVSSLVDGLIKKNYIMESAPAVGDTALSVIENGSNTNIELEAIHEKNKLILFGGFSGFIERMNKDNVTPDAKTLTLMLNCAPESLAIENNLIEIARFNKINLDIDFFNMLIKKRSFRRDYKNAKEVLNDIQRIGVHPDVITWGVLALGCQSHEDALALLEGMDATGHTLNTVIAGALIGNACSTNQYKYILDIMRIMKEEKVAPSKHLYKIIDKFINRVENSLVEKKKKISREKLQRFKENIELFKKDYEKWKKNFDNYTEKTH
ncbi:pentatricopeptide repeat-containing protein 1, mitochondrial [Aphidius gifuensis]|nr:pentatricopeptide repeat-containing protein 1, mitochondrial [Aphidius gifuensis]